MNVHIRIVRVYSAVPRTAAFTGDTQPLRSHATRLSLSSFTLQRIALLVGLAFLAGVVLPLHPALCIGTFGVLVAVFWKISICAVQP